MSVRGFVILVAASLYAAPMSAQEAKNPIIRAASGSAKNVETYAPSGVAFLGKLLDWNSSQPLFAKGYYEKNPEYTKSGKADDVPITYGAGLRKIGRVTAQNFGVSFGVSVGLQLVGDKFRRQKPQHKQAIKRLTRVGQIAAQTYLAYKFSARNFRQASRNTKMAGN